MATVPREQLKQSLTEAESNIAGTAYAHGSGSINML